MNTSGLSVCSTTAQRPTSRCLRRSNIAKRPCCSYVGNDGKGEMTNYRVKDQTYIVDRLFDRANLVLGSGKKAQKVEISHGHK